MAFFNKGVEWDFPKGSIELPKIKLPSFGFAGRDKVRQKGKDYGGRNEMYFVGRYKSEYMKRGGGQKKRNSISSNRGGGFLGSKS